MNKGNLIKIKEKYIERLNTINWIGVVIEVYNKKTCLIMWHDGSLLEEPVDKLEVI